MSTLFEYENSEKPQLSKQLSNVRHPTRKSAGIGGIHRITNRNDDPLTMMARRTRHGNGENEVQDYFRKVGGYSMPVETIDGLLRNDVKVVLIKETDNDRLLEFQTVDFRDHDGPDDWKGAAQYCIPTENAIREWSQ